MVSEVNSKVEGHTVPDLGTESSHVRAHALGAVYTPVETR